jgi:hypothetical protein
MELEKLEELAKSDLQHNPCAECGAGPDPRTVIVLARIARAAKAYSKRVESLVEGLALERVGRDIGLRGGRSREYAELADALQELASLH